MATRVLTPVAVTFTREAAPGTEYQATARDRLRVQNGSGVDANAYLKYVVNLSDTESLVSLIHTVRAEEAVSSVAISAQLTEVYNRLSDVNFNNASTKVPTVGSPVSDTDTLTWSHELVSEAPSGGTIIVRLSTAATALIWLRGPRAARFGPTLTVETETVATQPTNVEPSGIVSVGAPFFTWLGQAGVDTVQVAAAAEDAAWTSSAGFSSPTWTSAETASDVHELDTAVAGWSGITAGSSADVSVRYRLASGWSPWSEPVTIERVAKPTVAITNPGATDADKTPPVTWTVTGGTQTAWRAWVTDPDGVILDDSDKLAGTDLDWTPTVGGVRGETQTYHLRVWDDVDRANTDADPAYAEDTQATTFTPTATVAGLTGFAVWQDDATPAIVPSWTRTAGTPDGVNISIGGDDLADVDGVDSGDVKIWTLPPNTDLTLLAAAVVNGDHSEDTLTADVRTNVTGLWIVDPETGRGFVLATGDSGAQLTLGGNVEVHNALYAATVIRNTLSLRGVEGSVTGTLAEWPGRTLAEQKADAEWLREHPERPVQLICGDLNVSVVVSDLVPMFNQQLTKAHRVMHDVTFNCSAA